MLSNKCSIEVFLESYLMKIGSKKYRSILFMFLFESTHLTNVFHKNFVYEFIINNIAKFKYSGYGFEGGKKELFFKVIYITIQFYCVHFFFLLVLMA